MGLQYRQQCVSRNARENQVAHLSLDGVYKAGFATTSAAYEEAVYPLFESLDRLETILNGKDYLAGDRITEADIRLFVTIVCTAEHVSRVQPHPKTDPV